MNFYQFNAIRRQSYILSAVIVGALLFCISLNLTAHSMRPVVYELTAYEYSHIDQLKPKWIAGCEQGDALDCIKFGGTFESSTEWIHTQGLDDRDSPIYYYHRACQLGNRDGCSHLWAAYWVVGEIERVLPGIQRDEIPVKLKNYCSQGSQVACVYYVELFHQLGQKENVAIMLNACRSGIVSACSFLQYSFYRSGISAEKIPGVREEAQQKACELGEAFTCVQQGDSFVKSDPPRAKSAYQKACDVDDPRGCTKLGDLLAPNEPKQAFIAYRRACDNEGTKGCILMALLALEGRAGDTVELQPLTILHKACQDKKEYLACGHLGLLNRDGVGVKRNRDQAYTLLLDACSHVDRRKEHDFCADLTGMIRADLPQVNARATALGVLNKQCWDAHYGEACYLLAQTRIENGEILDEDSRDSIYSRACEDHHAKSCLLIADLELHPENRCRESDPKQARKYLQEVCPDPAKEEQITDPDVKSACALLAKLPAKPLPRYVHE